MRIYQGTASTLWGMNGGQPESPDGRFIVYNRKKSLENDETEICICDRETLSQHRVLFKVSCMNHNGASASWIDNSRIVFRDSINKLPAFRILNVDTGEVEYGPIFAKESHCAENGIYPFSLSKELAGVNCGYPELRESGIYTLDVKTGEIRMRVSGEEIRRLVRGHGCTADEHTAAVSHVQLNPSATAVMMRLGVPECPVFGALGCVELDSGRTHLIKDKPVHQLWFDDTTYMAARQFADGKHIQMHSSYIARFSMDGEETEVLGGVGNHIGASPDRSLFAGDRAYPGYRPNVYLYRRGDKEPVKEIEIPNAQDTVWRLKVHPNPTFSRDGRRLYYNCPLPNAKAAAMFCQINY